MKEIEQRIIEKQDELIKYLTRFKKWVLLHTPEINASQRGKDFLSAILTRESELSALRAEQGECDVNASKNVTNVIPVEQSKLSAEEILEKWHKKDNTLELWIPMKHALKAMKEYHAQFEEEE